MDLTTVFKQGDWILIGVFFILIIMSILTWTLIIIRVSKLYQAKKANKELQSKIWAAKNWEEVTHLVNQNNSAVAKITMSAINAKQHYIKYSGKELGIACPLDEFLTRAIRRSLTHENSKFEYGLTTLASIGATAPFIGLFGTVWGIYHALVNIGMSGQMNIGAVSGPIGEALIATAAGLAAAIPAVLAYNALTRSNKVLSRELDHFAHDLHAQIIFPTE